MDLIAKSIGVLRECKENQVESEPTLGIEKLIMAGAIWYFKRQGMSLEDTVNKAKIVYNQIRLTFWEAKA